MSLTNGDFPGAAQPSSGPPSQPGGAISNLGIRSLDAPVAPTKTAAEEAQQGRLTFRFVRNDGHRENLRYLVDLKTIIRSQLPEMDGNYIVRLVFDRSHENIALVRDGVVIGGICFRPFYDRKFVEIVFLAVNIEAHGKGYGSVLMQNLKEGVKRKGVTHLLTYADNEAIGYFRKQGFTREITLPHSVWVGCIKDYQMATLVECIISYDVNYREVIDMTRRQRSEINRILERKTPFFVLYPGLSCFSDQKYAQVNPEKIPGLKEAGFSAARRQARVDQVKLKSFLTDLFGEIRKHSHAWPFQEPVNGEEVKDYYQIIKDPIDLTVIQERLENDFYVTLSLFLADIRRMCQNCKTFNAANSPYYQCGVQLMEFVEKKVQESSFGLPTPAVSPG